MKTKQKQISELEIKKAVSYKIINEAYNQISQNMITGELDDITYLNRAIDSHTKKIYEYNEQIKKLL